MKLIKKYKKIIILISIIIMVFIIYKCNNKNNINYTSLGDGYSLGVNSFGEINYGYSDYLKDYLIKQNKLNIYEKNFSEKEMSIEKLHANIIINKEIIKNKKTINIKRTLRESNILTMSIGLNDLIYKISIEKNINDKKLYDIVNNIEKEFNYLIKEIRKYYQNDIYVIGYYNSSDNSIYVRKGIDMLNKMYSQNKNIIYINVKNNDNYILNPNSFYPNTKGYKEIFNIIQRKITKKLEKN